ncbi:MAG TPA: hypothetical protein VIL60_04880 [Rhodanobacter sp.]
MPVPPLSVLQRPLQTALLGCLLLSACTPQPATRPAKTSTAPRAAAHTTPGEAPSVPASPARERTSSASPSDQTGIVACDDYLSSYLACHRAAGIYSPQQLPLRYEAMRSSLLRDANNPQIRPQLAARCNSLASQLREALHGKSCAVNPEPASSSP